MQNLIGEKLETALKIIKENNLAYEIINNNFSVEGDTKLVTNVIAKDNTVYLTVGSFIFDVEGRKVNENK